MDKQKTTKAQEMHAVEMMIGYILRIGVIVSAIVIIIGMLLMLIQGNGGYANGMEPHTVADILAGIVAVRFISIDFNANFAGCGLYLRLCSGKRPLICLDYDDCSHHLDCCFGDWVSR